MDDVLSQSEIDSLLNALSSGELDADKMEEQKTAAEGEYNRYDFKRPNKYSKDQLRTLFLIHDNFARMVSNFLSAYMRSNVQLKLENVEQTTYEDFIVSIPSPTLITMFKMKPKDEFALMVYNSGFFFPIIDLLFGGSGEMVSMTRELTDIELKIMRNLNERVLEYFAYAWEDVYDVSPEIDSLETNPVFSQLYSPTETVALVTLSTTMHSEESFVSICIPYIVLESIITRLSAQHWFASTPSEGAGDDMAKIATKQMQMVPVELMVTLGEASITVEQFLNLNKGDVVTLNNTYKDELDLWVGQKKKFKVQPGTIGQKKGVLINRTQ